jgi:hypothetical protein
VDPSTKFDSEAAQAATEKTSKAKMMYPFLSSPVVAALIAGGLGLLAVWLGLRRYRSEKWWERKASAYAAIIESLHAIEDSYDEEIEAIQESVNLPLERLEKLRVAERDARAEIRKFANQGGFTITAKAADALDELIGVLGRQQLKKTKEEYYAERATAATMAIVKIKCEAKVDLKT